MPRSGAVRVGAVVAALVLAIVVWYLGSPLFIRTTANEALPTVSVATATSATSPATTVGATATPACTSATSLSRRGQLQYVDALHNGKGAVVMGVSSLVRCGVVGDAYFLRFEDVAITNAPDVHVYLSKDTGGKWNEATSKYLGPLKATNGSFNYDVAPSDAGEYKSVVVWCRAFTVLITWADLGP
ncbi:MAG TPA: DM13 domain-containing protein [Candidatus Limnocylindria bacterium]